jgi:hypothetical protein
VLLLGPTASGIGRGWPFPAVLDGWIHLLACLTTGVGVALAVAVKENTRAIAAGIGFSVGMMVLISVLELVPEAVAAMGAGPSLASAWWPWPSRFTTCPRNSPWRFPR